MSISWQLIEQQATTRLAGRTGRLNVEKPQLGLRLGDSQQSSLQLLRVRPEWSETLSPARAYVREHDLVINYGGDRALPFQLQIYWCRRSFPDAVECNAMEWTLAMQTGNLDKRSQLKTSTAGYGATQVLHLASSNKTDPELIDSTSALYTPASTGCILVRMGETSYIELIHPQDFHAVEVVREADKSGFAINRSMFDCVLEKGVIVRSRLFGLCVPRSNDVSLLHEAYQALLHRDLPLTT